MHASSSGRRNWSKTLKAKHQTSRMPVFRLLNADCEHELTPQELSRCPLSPKPQHAPSPATEITSWPDACPLAFQVCGRALCDLA